MSVSTRVSWSVSVGQYPCIMVSKCHVSEYPCTSMMVGKGIDGRSARSPFTILLLSLHDPVARAARVLSGRYNTCASRAKGCIGLENNFLNLFVLRFGRRAGDGMF